MIPISICIPLYCTEKYICRCLDSVINQTFESFEIIIVDDCSPDNSYAIAMEYAHIDDRIRVIRHERNLGLGGARNTGIREASGEYVMLIDSDDTLRPNALEVLYNKTCVYHPDMIVFGVDKEYQGGDRAPFVRYEEDEFLTNGIFARYMSSEFVIPAAYNKLYRRDVLTRSNIEYPEYVYHQDVCTQPIILFGCESVLLIKEVLYDYLQRDGSAVASISVRHIESVQRVLKSIKDFLVMHHIWEVYKNDYYDKYVWKFGILHHFKRILNYAQDEDVMARLFHDSIVSIMEVVDSYEFLRLYGRRMMLALEGNWKGASSFYRLFGSISEVAMATMLDGSLDPFFERFGPASSRVSDVLIPRIGKWMDVPPRIGIYGIGEHTRFLLGSFPCLWNWVVGFIDRTNVDEFLGKPCMRPECVGNLGIDTILYSSREFEKEMFHNVKDFRGEHVFLYTNNDG